MADTSSLDRDNTVHYFVDEAGDPTLFDARGRTIVGQPGCSGHFIIGKLEVEEPETLTQSLEALRRELLADPYFKGVPSMQPAARKAALMFHAKDDAPEIRREVYRLLLRQKVRFYAIVRDKSAAALHEARLREANPQYRYRPNDLYDTLVSRLFRRRGYAADRFEICFSKRYKRDRTAALRKALENAVAGFELDFGVKSRAMLNIRHSTPQGSGGLQAVDYFLWALQRFYQFEHTDKRETECRYVELIHDLTGEIDDVDYLYEGRVGVFWGKHRPLCLAARAAGAGAKK